MEIPQDLFYTESHEWVRVEDNTATVGITDFAQKQLRDVVYVELPEVGRELKKGESMGVVESVKTVADIYCPVSGKVVGVNTELTDNPQYVNEDPFGKGWMVKLAMSNREELDGLLTAGAYRDSLPEE